MLISRYIYIIWRVPFVLLSYVVSFSYWPCTIYVHFVMQCGGTLAKGLTHVHLKIQVYNYVLEYL